MDNIIKQLRQLKIKLLSQKRFIIFNKIHKRIYQQKYSDIKTLIQDTKLELPEANFAKNSKERLLQKISKVEKISWTSLSIFLSKIYRNFITALVVSVLFLLIIISPSMIEAGTRNELFVTKGSISFKSQQGSWQKITNKVQIKKGDQIKTDENTTAEIYFSDNSVVRISQKTHLLVKNFYLEKDVNKNNLTELKLYQGKIWANVLPSNIRKKFTVKTKQATISTTFGAFDLEFNNFTKIRSIKNSVYIENIIGKKSPILLSAGFQAEMLDNLNFDISPLIDLKNDKWAKNNQEKDELIRKEVIVSDKKKMKNEAGILPNSPFYKVEQVVESIHLDSLEKIKRKFAEIKVLINAQENILAFKLWDELKNDIKIFVTDLPEINLKKAQDFLKNEKLLFSKIFPTDALFVLKKPLTDLIIQYSDNPEKEKINFSSETLIETQSLALNPLIEHTTIVALLDDFSEQNNQLLEEILQENTNNQKELLKELLSKQNQELDQIQVISKNIDNEQVTEKTVEVKQNIVNSIQKIVSKIAPEKSPKKMNKNQTNWFVDQIDIMVKKVETYSSKKGRSNTIYWILSQIEDHPDNLTFLYALKNAMPDDVKLAISKKILKIRQNR